MLMETNRVTTFIQYDNSIRTTHEGARNLTNPPYLESCQQPCTSADAVPVPSDRVVSMAELMARYSLDYPYASLRLDQATEPDNDMHMPPPSCADTNPNDLTCSHGDFECNGNAHLDSMGQHLNEALLNNPATHAGTLHDHCPTPMASEYSFPDYMPSLFSTSSNPSHETPLSQQEHSAKTPLMAPNHIKARMDGPSGYQQSPVFEPFANTGRHSDVEFSTPLPYPSLDSTVQKLCLHLGSQDHTTHLESDSHQQVILNLPSRHNGTRCLSPDIIHERGQGDPLSLLIINDSHTDYPPPRHPTLDHRAQSYGGHLHNRMQSERTSGHRRGLTCPPYRIPNKTMANQIRRPQLRPLVHKTGRIPEYAVSGQAPPTSTHTAGKNNVTASSPTFSETRYNYPTQQMTIWDGVGWLFPAANPTWTYMEHSSGQHPDRVLSSSAYPAYQDDVEFDTRSTSSFSGWRDNGTRSPSFSPKAQLPNPLNPSRTPPFQHDIPCQETVECTPDCSNLDEASPNSPDAAEVGHSVALSLILADEEQSGPSLSPATHPSNALRAQQRLQNILGLPSPLTNKALITLLRLILESSFVWTHEMESTIESDYGQALLPQVKSIPDCPPNVLQLARGSIYTAFVSYPEFICLICGKPKQSMTRGIGCVRSHLNHRPFPCRAQRGCKSCPNGQIVRRFFTASLLHDHRSSKGTPCTSCGATLRSSMKRHWDKKHYGVPFPYDHYPRYRKEQPPQP